MVGKDSILKWRYSINLFKPFRFKIILDDPSFFRVVKIGEVYSPFSCSQGTIAPLCSRLCISTSHVCVWSGSQQVSNLDLSLERATDMVWQYFFQKLFFFKVFFQSFFSRFYPFYNTCLVL